MKKHNIEPTAADIERTELISRFLNGEMSESEKENFMLQCDSDPTLKADMKLQENIMWELRAQAMKRKLAGTVSSARFRNVVMCTLGIAASLLAVCTVTYKHYENKGIEISTPVITQIVTPVLRGTAAQEQKIDTAYIHIKEGNLELAQLELKSAIKNLEDELEGIKADEVSAEEYAYNRQVAASLLHRARYLQALCSMQQGNVITARIQLNKIAESDSPYRKEAKDLLEKW